MRLNPGSGQGSPRSFLVLFTRPLPPVALLREALQLLQLQQVHPPRCGRGCHETLSGDRGSDAAATQCGAAVGTGGCRRGLGNYVAGAQDRCRHPVGLPHVSSSPSSFPRVESVFFGGGTPSLASPHTVAAVLEAVAQATHLPADSEVTLEANPTSAPSSRLAAFRAAGVNRLSIGLQVTHLTHLILAHPGCLSRVITFIHWANIY